LSGNGPIEYKSRVNRLAVWEGWLSIIINTLLFGLKYWVGITTASIAIIADAWHTLSDSFTSLVVLWGAKSSVRPPDRKHPFGHGRVEVIASVIIGAILATVGLNFLIESVRRLINRETAAYSALAIVVFAVSVICKEALARFSIRSGRKTDSRSLIADGWHHRSDAIASALILIGILVGRYFWWIDGVLGIAVALVIFWATFDILRNSVSSLIGEQPDAELIERLRRLVGQSVAYDVDLHHLHLHQYGQHKELTFHISLPQDLRLKEAHNIANTLETMIHERLGLETTIHVDPREQAEQD
jgi:cation diffusion facilitator family transporter